MLLWTDDIVVLMSLKSDLGVFCSELLRGYAPPQR